MTASPMTSPTEGCVGKADSLLSVGIGKGRHDLFPEWTSFAPSLIGPVFTRSHQMELIANTLATLQSQFEQFAKLLIVDLAVRIQQLQQTGERLLNASDITSGDPPPLCDMSFS